MRLRWAQRLWPSIPVLPSPPPKSHLLSLQRMGHLNKQIRYVLCFLGVSTSKTDIGGVSVSFQLFTLFPKGIQVFAGLSIFVYMHLSEVTCAPCGH